MKGQFKLAICAMAALLAGGIAFTACSTKSASSDPLAQAFRNLTADQCDNQQATLSQLPLTFVTPGQAANLLAGACAALFGTAAAPTPAPGMQPAIPGPATPTAAATTTATAVATPAP